MEVLLDFFIDCLIDTIKMIPFLFVAFLIIELIEHKLNDKSRKIIEKSGRFGPLFGGILGAFPQCGFSVLTTNLYITRIVSIGTLIAVYLSTSDEMIPVMLSNNVPLIEVLKIVSLKIVVGIIFGFIIDFVFRHRDNTDYRICEEDTCDCKDSIIKSTFIHTLKTSGFILFSYVVIGLIMVMLDKERIIGFFLGHPLLAPMISSLFGLIPNCAASILITQLYINGIIPFGTTMSGLLTGSGIAVLLLFKNNKNIKESILICIMVYLIGVLVGLLINILGVL